MTHKPLEGVSCLFVPFVADRRGDNRAGPEVLDVSRVAVTTDACPIFLSGHQVLGRYDLTPPFGITVIGASHVFTFGHLALKTCLTILVDGLMYEQMFCGSCFWPKVLVLFREWTLGLRCMGNSLARI